MLILATVRCVCEYYLFDCPTEARCRSAQHDVSGVRGSLASLDMERTESQMSIVELTEVNVCLQFVFFVFLTVH